MEDKDLLLKKLKNRRFNLREKIRSYVKNGTNARHLVIEFHEVIRQLNEAGFNAYIEKDYLQLEYWDDFDKSVPVPKIDKKIKPTTKESGSSPLVNTQVPPTDSKHSYILCLAWTINKGNEIPIQVKKVLDYFNELCLEFVNEDTREINNYIEHEIKYKFEGTEDAFRLLKICVQFVLDTFAKTDFDKFNIAVYGKKRNF